MSPIHSAWPPVFDAWSPLDYKQVQWGSRFGGIPWLAPSWVGGHRRRLQAYKILQSYLDNCSRNFLDMEPDPKDGYGATLRAELEHREYGDANTLREVILAALIGDRQEIHVDGADDYDENAPDLLAPREGNVPSDPNHPVDSRSVVNTPEAKAAWELQNTLREWADAERFNLKLIEEERDAIGLGDGIYALGFQGAKNRPRLNVYDPGFYFPVLDAYSDDAEFPKRVHIAWEIRDDFEMPTTKVRRITYDLRRVAPYAVPWSKDPAVEMCFMTDAIFEVDRMNAKLDDFTEATSFATITDQDGTEIAVDEIPLGIDFIPVIHVPNTVSIKNHYGTSSLLNVTQLLDDLQMADSDYTKAIMLTGSPMLGFSGSNAPANVAVGPGQALNLGENGKIDVIDASKGLAEMRAAIDNRLRRLSTNARVPEAVLGRIDAHRVQAGIVLTLSFGPLITLVKELRLVRAEKYALLFKFVQRFYQQAGVLAGGDTLKANVVFGSYLPSDQGAAATMVAGLLGAKAISRATAVKILIANGVEIDDIAKEVAEIDAEDFAGALNLSEATGNDTELVGEYLGRKITGVTPDPITLNLRNPPPANGNRPPEPVPANS